MDLDSCLVLTLIICFSGKSDADSILKCYGGYFNDELCPQPLTIKVTSATYGLSDCRSTIGACCPKETDCEIPVTGKYLENIQTECNGRQKCGSSLRGDSTIATECGILGPTDYVTIHYDCLQDQPTEKPKCDAAPNTGLIIGVTTGINLIILLVVVTMMTVFYRWKYQKNNNPERCLERADLHPQAIQGTERSSPLTNPISNSESENLSESVQPEGCHLYAEIDKPCLVACPMPPKTPMPTHDYINTCLHKDGNKPVENRPGSSSAENQYEAIVN